MELGAEPSRRIENLTADQVAAGVARGELLVDLPASQERFQNGLILSRYHLFTELPRRGLLGNSAHSRGLFAS